MGKKKNKREERSGERDQQFFLERKERPKERNNKFSREKGVKRNEPKQQKLGGGRKENMGEQKRKKKKKGEGAGNDRREILQKEGGHLGEAEERKGSDRGKIYIPEKKNNRSCHCASSPPPQHTT
jgi:hypothetical protein